MAVEKATPRARTHQTKAPTPPPTSSTRAHLPQQSVKAQGVDQPKREEKVTIRSRIAAVKVRLARVGAEGQGKGKETDRSQRFISIMRLKSTITVTR